MGAAAGFLLPGLLGGGGLFGGGGVNATPAGSSVQDIMSLLPLLLLGGGALYAVSVFKK
jgi:hypothetical protein